MNRKKDNSIIWILVVLAGLVGVIAIPDRRLSFVIFLILSVLCYYRFVIRRAKGKTLVCGKCGHEMKISTLKYLATPHEQKSHYLTCAKCGYRECFLKEEKKK